MKKSPKVSRLFTLTRGGNLVYLAEVGGNAISIESFRKVAYEIIRRARRDYPNLILSPETTPDSSKFKWSHKKGGYQGLPQI